MRRRSSRLAATEAEAPAAAAEEPAAEEAEDNVEGEQEENPDEGEAAVDGEEAGEAQSEGEGEEMPATQAELIEQVAGLERELRRYGVPEPPAPGKQEEMVVEGTFGSVPTFALSDQL
jgi:hypothetical protein